MVVFVWMEGGRDLSDVRIRRVNPRTPRQTGGTVGRVTTTTWDVSPTVSLG